MGASKNMDDEILDQHIINIRAQLRDLNYQYNLNYIFGYAKGNDFDGFKRGMYYNRFINIAVLNDFILDLIQLKRELNFWLHLISIGEHVVYCVNDENQQLNLGHKVFSGDFYLVEQILVNHFGELEFLLHGLDSGTGNGGYSNKRFVKLINYSNNN